MDQNDKLLTYEFIHETSVDNYKNCKGDTKYEHRHSKYFTIKNITRNDIYVRNESQKCSNPLNWEAELLGENFSDYQHRSCDPIKFEYNEIPITSTKEYANRISYHNSETLDNYEFDENLRETIKTMLINLGLKENDMTTFIAEAITLPELNYLSSFRNIGGNDTGSFIIDNNNLKAPSITSQIFNEKLVALQALYIEVENDNKFKTTIDNLTRLIIDNHNPFNNKGNRLIYITKLAINKKADICFFGDIHGSIHTLLRSILRLFVLGYINNEYKLRDDFYIIFLGDLVDRSIYGVECIYFIMMLKLLNPDNIYIIRGNHEECCTSTNYRLDHEFDKIDASGELYIQYCRTWIYLPVAIFLTKLNSGQYIQLCHGGVFRNLDVIDTFLKSENKILCMNHNRDPSDSIKDFQWSDFIAKNLNEAALNRRINRQIYGNGADRNAYCINEINEYLKRSSIRAIIRGHQDTYDNTKLLSFTLDGSLPKIELYEPKEIIKSSDDISSFTIPLPENSNLIDNYFAIYNFSPVITLSTGIPSRLIDSDGFAILKWHIDGHFGGYRQKYLKYKAQYLNLKKNFFTKNVGQ